MNRKPVIWIHGVQGEKLDPKPIQDCITEVKKLMGTETSHFIFDWDSVVGERQRKLWEKIKGRGNWLTRAIKKGICFTGTDLWWNLQSKKGGASSDVYSSIQEKLERLVKDLLNSEKKLYLVCHSWGTWEGLQFIINHPEIEFVFITLGCPLPYGSGSFSDWGDPSKLSQIKKWVNIGIPNDPISEMFKNIPCDDDRWINFVEDIDISCFNPLPIKSHSLYWHSSKVQKIISNTIGVY